MAFDSDLLSMMAGTFTHKATTGHSGYGAQTVGTTTSGIPCHVTYMTRIIRGNTEESAVSSATIECPPGGYLVSGVIVPTIAVDDHITLADNVERRVLQLQSFTDDTGAWHQSIALT
jgi:hypothetical protein